MTKFGMVAQVGRSMFLRGQPCLHPNWRGPGVLHFFATSYGKQQPNFACWSN